MRIRALLAVIAIGLFSGSEASAGLIDIADGASVILNGDYGVLTNFCCGWDPAEPSAPGSTLTDGILRPQATVWQEGAVWWDATNPGSAANSIEIDLGGFYSLRAFSVQADDNDTYRIEVLNRIERLGDGLGYSGRRWFRYADSTGPERSHGRVFPRGLDRRQPPALHRNGRRRFLFRLGDQRVHPRAHFDGLAGSGAHGTRC